MLCFSAVRQAGNMAKSLCACLFCMICGGPILLIVGIVVLVSPNTREDDVKEYNAVVAAYSTSDSDLWTPGTISTAATALTTQQVSIKGSEDDVDAASSRYARAYVSSSSSPSTLSVSIATITLFTISPTYTQQRTTSGDCQYDSCSSGSGVTCPSGATWTGPSRCSEGTCGTCSYTVYLSTYCSAVTKSGLTWSVDTGISCFYGSSALYSTSYVSSIEFQVRQSGDPYIALQRITKGDDDFGITRSQQTISGLVLIIIGCLMIACICVIGFIVYKLVKKFIVKDDEDNVGEQGNSGGNDQAYYNPTSNNNNNAPSAPPNQPSSKPSGYGQPASTGYGYGTPPPPPPAPYNNGPSSYPSAQPATGYNTAPQQQSTYPSAQPATGYNTAPQQQSTYPPAQHQPPYSNNNVPAPGYYNNNNDAEMDPNFVQKV